MSKADLQAAQTAYDAAMAEAMGAERSGQYAKAVARAIEAWEHVDGMMKYERRWEKREFDSLPCVDLVLKHAPLLLDRASLDRLEQLLRMQKGVERHTSDDLGERLRAARKTMWAAYRLWSRLEKDAVCPAEQPRDPAAGRQEEWAAITSRWEAMGILRRDSGGTLSLATRLDDRVRARCPECGVIGVGPKRVFLSEQECKACKKRTFFVLMSDREAGGGGKE